MGKQGVLTLLLGGVLGANIVMACWIVSLSIDPNPVMGQTVDTAGAYTVASGRLQSRGEADAIFVFSHVDKKLVVYFQGGKGLELLSVRNCEYDFKPNQYGKQFPDVKAMKKELGG